jgi:hypothetical protein
MGSWDQQPLANSFNTMALVSPAVIDWDADNFFNNHWPTPAPTTTPLQMPIT